MCFVQAPTVNGATATTVSPYGNPYGTAGSQQQQPQQEQASQGAPGQYGMSQQAQPQQGQPQQQLQQQQQPQQPQVQRILWLDDSVDSFCLTCPARSLVAHVRASKYFQ